MSTTTLVSLGVLASACGSGDEPGSSNGAPLTLCAARNVPIQGKPAADPSAPPDESCVGIPPVTDCNGLKFCGKATRIVIAAKIVGATYEFFDSHGKSLAKQVTDDSGDYCATIPDGAEGFVGRIELSKDGYRTHDAYLAALPWAASHDAFSFGIEKEADLVNIFPDFGAPAPDPAKGIVDPFILDCAMQYLPPVSVELDRPYEARLYVAAGSKLDASAQSSTAGQLSGALFVDVDPGPVVATFRLIDANGQPGAIVGTSAGEVKAGHWTALPAFPSGN